MPVTKESSFIISTLVNQLGAADGASLPPRQRGVTRVPVVSALRVLKAAAFVGGTEVTLVWSNPKPPFHRSIDHYNVYVTGPFLGSNTTQGPSAFATSPATLKLESSGGIVVTAYVQTQMKSGIVSDLFGSPAVSFTTKVSDLVEGASTLTTPGSIVLVGASPGELTELIGPLPVGSGGTELTGGTSGGILGFTDSSTLVSSAELLANAIVLGGGAGATPSTPVSLGTTTTVLHGNAGGAPSFAAVSLTADVAGTLAVGNGGTGATGFTTGSVIFSNGTILTQDNASLFFDDSTNRLGIGTATPKSTLESGGSFGLKVKSIVVGDSPYTAAAETVILADATGGAITVALPALSGVAGRIYHVKKIDATANTVTLDASGAENIDGITTQVLTTQYQSFMIFAGPSEWSII